jgi:hypothetical protein
MYIKLTNKQDLDPERTALTLSVEQYDSCNVTVCLCTVSCLTKHETSIYGILASCIVTNSDMDTSFKIRV